MKFEKMNLLEISNPSACICNVAGYMVKEHPYLAIEINPPDDNKIYLNFSDVHYIDISETWTGANFGLATNTELSRVLKCLDLDHKDGFYLYGCPVEPNQNRWVKILAGELSITTEAPYYLVTSPKLPRLLLQICGV